jgi:glycosyltransferase involved in cell wall biosynthesis
MSAPLVSIVLPCRNQADHIGSILPRYIGPLEAVGLSFELIVVPNASSDRTKEVVEELAERDARIRVVPIELGGWGRSVRSGLEASAGDILAYTNTARTDPGLIPAFLETYLAQQPCLVKARREARSAPMREIGSAIYNLEGRVLFGIGAKDVNGTPKVFSRELYRSAQLASNDDLLDLELMAQAARCSIPIVEIPVRGFKRHGGKSSTTMQSAWKMYSGAVRLWAARRRSA